jgi:hypothetical protein
LVQAGLDPWVVWTSNKSLPDTFVIDNGSLIGILAINSENSEDMTMLDDLIDAGYFDNRSQAEIQAFFNLFGSYAQRGDERSQQIKMIATRILKRNQNYDASLERDNFGGTKAIFKNHLEDKEVGIIPWELIRSE